MSDLEWYLDVGGKQSGPHTAKEIVELVRSGKIPANSHVTAARMSGDWVAAQDLVDAYNELYAKKTVPAPIDGTVPFSSSSSRAATPVDPNFAPPPRPTEQLEASKIIDLNQLAKTPDPTDALFQAIQAVREKASQKAATTAPLKTTTDTRENWGGRPSRAKVSPQLILIVTLAMIFGVTIYGITVLLGGKSETATETAETLPREGALERSAERPPTHPPNLGGNKLLDDGGPATAGGAVRAGNAVRARSDRPTKNTRNQPRLNERNRPDPRNRPEPRGGARYRDERDEDEEEMRRRLQDQAARYRDQQDMDEDVDMNEDGMDMNRRDPIPVDPSQVNPDQIIPEPGVVPGGMAPGGTPGGIGPDGMPMENSYDAYPPRE